jgi:hypothetical protein
MIVRTLQKWCHPSESGPPKWPNRTACYPPSGAREAGSTWIAKGRVSRKCGRGVQRAEKALLRTMLRA